MKSRFSIISYPHAKRMRDFTGPLLIGEEVYVGCRTELSFGTKKVSENTGQIEVGRMKLSAPRLRRAEQDVLITSNSL